jgi:hypothetical protein
MFADIPDPICVTPRPYACRQYPVIFKSFFVCPFRVVCVGVAKVDIFYTLPNLF